MPFEWKIHVPANNMYPGLYTIYTFENRCLVVAATARNYCCCLAGYYAIVSSYISPFMIHQKAVDDELSSTSVNAPILCDLFIAGRPENRFDVLPGLNIFVWNVIVGEMNGNSWTWRQQAWNLFCKQACQWCISNKMLVNGESCQMHVLVSSILVS